MTQTAEKTSASRAPAPAEAAGVTAAPAESAAGPAPAAEASPGAAGNELVSAANEAVARVSTLVRGIRLPSFTVPRARLIPGVIFVAVLMLGIRTNDLLTGLNAGSFDVGVPTQAQDSAVAPATAEPAPEESAEVAPVEPPTIESSVAMLPPESRSETERDLLQSLAARRAELELREKELSQREALLAVAEQRLAEKTAELENLRVQIEGLLVKVDEQRESQLASLVGIYENMRPSDAAAIFDGLDLDVLLNVLDRMREQKSAAILAGMNPERARQVTTELAQRQQPPKL